MKVSPKPDDKTKPPATSPAGTLLSPLQHRAMAQQIVAGAGKPGFPPPEQAQRMAADHEQLAQAIERRARPNQDLPS